MKVIIFLSLIIFIFSFNYTNLSRFYRRIQLECEQLSDVNYNKFNELNSTGELKFKTENNLGDSYYHSRIYQFSVSVGESITKMIDLIKKKEIFLSISTETEAKSFIDKLENITDFYVHDQIRKQTFRYKEYAQFTTFKAFVNNDGNNVTYVIFIDNIYVKQFYGNYTKIPRGFRWSIYYNESLSDSETEKFLLYGIGNETLGNSKDIFDEKKKKFLNNLFYIIIILFTKFTFNLFYFY